MTENRQKNTHSALSPRRATRATALVLLTLCAVVDAQLYRPQQERRTVTTEAYELMIQRNGQVDITLRNQAPVFDNARPAVQLAGRPIQPLPVDWRRTNRANVQDSLGQGQGFTFVWRECEWYLRTYPVQPFLTIQVVYVNTGKQPVRVEKLIPWTTGLGKGGLSLGGPAEVVRVLEHGDPSDGVGNAARARLGGGVGEGSLALFQPASGRGLVAGFLTNITARTQLVVEDLPGAPHLHEVFRAECIYDPPVEVPPGGRLESEVLYLSVAETDLFEGLRRFGKAQGVWNRVRPEVPLMPHGWDSARTHHGHDITEAALLRELEVLDRELKPYGWNHFAVGAGWEQAQGDWDAHPERFPRGMAWLAGEIHARGMTAGLRVAPFSVARTASLAREHPDWLREPDARGRDLMGEDTLILDVTVPEAHSHVRDLARKFTQDWGYDAIMDSGALHPLLLAESYARPNTTRVEVLRLGMEALQEGLGPRKFLLSMPPQTITGIYAHGVRMGPGNVPVWQASGAGAPWGAVESLGNASRRFYHSPHLYVMDPDCAFFPHEDVRQRGNVQDHPALTPEQSIAWLTGAALTGGAVTIGNAFSTLGPQELDVLRKLLPVPEEPAIPVDLFEEGTPRIWRLPLRTPAGEWQLLAFFNWDPAQAARLGASFAELRLPPEAYYTVYDFWRGQYHGLATGRIDIEVPPGSVRLLGLRPYEHRPMLLASDRHIAQGALEYTRLVWDSQTNTLEGVFTAMPNIPYTIRLLVPEPYHLEQITHGGAPLSATLQDQTHTFTLTATTPGETTWSAAFRHTP